MKRIVICSGAGLSVASGLPTFRCQGGLWEQYDINKVCFLPTFLENYILSNEFYAARRAQLKTVEPNAAHIGLVAAQKALADVAEVVHYTTNVDNLLERAGAVNVNHVHGNLTELITRWGTPEAKVVDADSVQWDDPSLYPVKPNVVFFYENAPMYQALYNEFTDLTSNDVVVVVGSSEQVVSFTYLAKMYPNQANRPKVIYITPDENETTYADVHIVKRAEDIDWVEFLSLLAK